MAKRAIATKEKVPDAVREAEAKQLLRLFIEKATLPQGEFGAQYGIGGQAYVHQLLQGHRPLNVKAALGFAQGLGVAVSDFSPRLHADLVKYANSSLANPRDTSNVEPATRPTGRSVPLISWVAAGSWNEAHDPYAPGAAEAWIDGSGAYSQAAFALRVRGDSMEPKFPEGCVIIVDPSRTAKSGDFVVVRSNDWNEVTFKRLLIDSGVKWLRPLNPQYQAMLAPPDAQVCGVVVEMIVREKF